MGYKTFEDMKQSIPEGATHYRNECESFLFTWFKETDSGIKFYEEVSQNWSLIGRHANNLKSKMVKIPSQTETPEEKEALDMIGTTSKQVESLAKGDVVEWKNGDECMIRGEKLIYIGESIESDIHCVQELGTCLYRNAHISVIEKPESQEQRAERDRLEAAYDLYCLFAGDGEFLNYKYEYFEFDRMNDFKNKWLAIVDKTGYRKQ